MGYFVDESNNNPAGGNYRLGPVVRLYAKRSQSTTFVDSTYAERAVAAHEAGAEVGPYHFAGRGNPVAEADFFLSQPGTRPKPGQLRVCVDVEDGQSVAWVEAFVKRCRAVLGYWPVFYANTSTGAPMRQVSAAIRACPWWRAEYNGRSDVLIGGVMGATAHQWTSNGQVPGLSGPRDLTILLRPGMLVPHPATRPVRKTTAAGWEWAQWVLGIGKYHGRGGRRRFRPHVPKRVPRKWWRYVRWYKRHGAAR